MPKPLEEPEKLETGAIVDFKPENGVDVDVEDIPPVKGFDNEELDCGTSLNPFINGAWFERPLAVDLSSFGFLRNLSNMVGAHGVLKVNLLSCSSSLLSSLLAGVDVLGFKLAAKNVGLFATIGDDLFGSELGAGDLISSFSVLVAASTIFGMQNSLLCSPTLYIGLV